MHLFRTIVVLLFFDSNVAECTSTAVSTDNAKISYKINSTTDYDYEYLNVMKNKLQLSGMSRNKRSSDFCSNDEPSKRIDCGGHGISRQECTERWCCFDDSIPGANHCFINAKGGLYGGAHTQDEKCDYNKPHSRPDCGFLTINQGQCEARGCCWDTRVYGIFARHCFFSSRTRSGRCGSDDLNCAHPCWDDTWLCNNGLCIPTRYRCDGDNDCGDSSDEQNCTVQVTTTVPPTTTVQPPKTVEPPRKTGPPTNGQPTTTTRPTTTARPTTTTRPTTTARPTITTRLTPVANCTSDQWRCHNGRCIQARFVCDWDNDCGDGSDEQNCLHGSCQTNQWRCNNGWCIDISFRCDGIINHCGDGSDEQNCPARTYN